MAKHTKRVGIVVATAQLYCRDVVHGIAEVGAEAGWRWLLVPTEAVPLVAPSVASLDGIIGHFDGVPASADLFTSAVPMVDFSYAGPRSRVVGVRTDELAVGRLAAAYLLSLGTGRFGFLGRHGRDESHGRQSGFTETLAAAGVPCEVFQWPAAEQFENVAERASADLVRWVASLCKPVSVFACDDRHAFQLLAACHQLDLSVPESVAILGVENDELLCELANPSISSIALSSQRIGYEAARTLSRLMINQLPEADPLLIPPAGVVPRASTSRQVILDEDVAAAVRYIAMHVQDHLQVGDVLREVLVSRRSLDQRFLKVLGRTPAEEISRAQVEIAKRALFETTVSMDAIASMAGFKNSKQLGATFRRVTGVTPTAYRKHTNPDR